MSVFVKSTQTFQKSSPTTYKTPTQGPGMSSVKCALGSVISPLFYPFTDPKGRRKVGISKPQDTHTYYTVCVSMTTTHNHDVTPMRFIAQSDVPLLFYKTEKSLPTQQNNFPRCSYVAVDQNKATFL